MSNENVKKFNIDFEIENIHDLENALEILLSNFTGELSKIKGFSLSSLYKFITIILTSAPIFIPTWNSTPENDKIEAISNVMNMYIDIPYISEDIEKYLIISAYKTIMIFM